MVRKLNVTLIRSAMAGVLMLAAPAMTWGAEEKKAEDAARIVQHMETHWQTLIRESDPTRRKALITEHRRIMAEARTASGTTPDGPRGNAGHGGMMGSDHRRDLLNTTELHSMMLDMMK